MDTDDLDPVRPTPAVRNLEPLSVAELNAYIGELEAEIARVRAAIGKKQNIRAGANSLFRK